MPRLFEGTMADRGRGMLWYAESRKKREPTLMTPNAIPPKTVARLRVGLALGTNVQRIRPMSAATANGTEAKVNRSASLDMCASDENQPKPMSIRPDPKKTMAGRRQDVAGRSADSASNTPLALRPGLLARVTAGKARRTAVAFCHVKGSFGSNSMKTVIGSTMDILVAMATTPSPNCCVHSPILLNM